MVPPSGGERYTVHELGLDDVLSVLSEHGILDSESVEESKLEGVPFYCCDCKQWRLVPYYEISDRDKRYVPYIVCPVHRGHSIWIVFGPEY